MYDYSSTPFRSTYLILYCVTTSVHAILLLQQTTRPHCITTLVCPSVLQQYYFRAHPSLPILPQHIPALLSYYFSACPALLWAWRVVGYPHNSDVLACRLLWKFIGFPLCKITDVFLPSAAYPVSSGTMKASQQGGGFQFLLILYSLSLITKICGIFRTGSYHPVLVQTKKNGKKAVLFWQPLKPL